MDKNNYEIEQFNYWQIIIYHLLPGIPVLLIAFVLTNPSFGINLPIFLSLIIAFIVCLIPIQWIIMKIFARKKSLKIIEIIGYKNKQTIIKTLFWSFPGIVLAAVIFTFGTEIERPFWTIFAFIPDWFRVNRTAIGMEKFFILTIFLNFSIRGLLLPFTEEIYFRGFLLPRMQKTGKFAPIISSALFSIYHFFTPWENISRMIAVLPFVYITWWKKNIYIGIISHCVVNLLSCIGMFVLIK